MSAAPEPGPRDDVVVENVAVDYGRVRAVDGVSFSVAAGELVTLLGRSGCGKTSTLRAIAGLERNSAGRISIGGTVVSDAERKKFVAPEHRNIGMVFQSYALWPHMTVAEAVAYPLRRRKVPKAERDERVANILATVGMERFRDRRVPELSGGQQQRVAIARALVYEPRLLLLDEPLSNLDARLRDRMRGEIKELQSRLGITTICVTHDQTEALTMSHRVIVMQNGRIEQIGTPEELYARPRTRFAGESVGRANTLPGRVVARAGQRVRIELDGAAQILEAGTCVDSVAAGDRALVIVRPEHIAIVAEAEMPAAGNVLAGVVTAAIFAGDHREYRVATGDAHVVVKAAAASAVGAGERVYLHLPAAHCNAVAHTGDVQSSESGGD